MPVVYRCSRCGFPLYVFVRVGQSSYGLMTPSEATYAFADRCPRCGKPLGKPSLASVRITADVMEAARRLYEEVRGSREPLAGTEMQLHDVVKEEG